MKTGLSDSLATLEQERNRLREEISLLPDFRQGSLSIVHPRCGKPSCHCAREEDPGHGPVYFLTRSVQKKTVTRSIPERNLETVRGQLTTFHRYQEISKDLVEVNVRICDLKLQESRGGASETVKKNTRKRPRS